MEKIYKFLRTATLSALLVMAVVFSIRVNYYRHHPVVLFNGGYLEYFEKEEAADYSGKIGDMQMSVQVWRDENGVNVTVFGENEIIHRCRVEYPEDSVTVNGEAFPAVTVIKDGVVLYDGYFNPDRSDLTPYDKRYELISADGASTFLDSDTNSSVATDIGLSGILSFALGPTLFRRGSWGMFSVVTLVLGGSLTAYILNPSARFFNRYQRRDDL